MTTTAGDRVHILGVGNMGKYVARGLKRARPELPVTLLFHRQNLEEQWQDAGKAIHYSREGYSDSTDGFEVEHVSEASRDTNLGPIKHLILLTKTYNTTLSLKQVKARLGVDSTVLFLQNGMGTADEACNALFEIESIRPKLWTGICSAGVYSTTPFSIVHAGIGPLLVGPNDVSGASNSYVAAMLYDARKYLSTSIISSSEIQVARLLKLVVNAILNPLTVIFRCKNRGALKKGPREDLIRALIGEIGPVVRRLAPPDSYSMTDDLDPKGQATLFADDSLVRRVLLTANRTGANTSSMLQDVQHNRQTEIDYINGYIVTAAQKLGLEYANNRTLVDMVKNRTVITDEDISSAFYGIN